MQRFFAGLEQIDEENKQIILTGGDVNHIRNVLRMRAGDEIWISDGSKYEYHCCIREMTEDSVILTILYRQEPEYELPGKIWLFQGLPKGDKMEFIIQKAVELGAYAVVPVSMKRCVVKLDEKRGTKKTARWQQISESAAKQSRRMQVPEVHEIVNLKGALELASKLDVVLVPYELARGMQETKQILAGITPGQSVGIFIGPEGGFDEEEIRQLTEAGAKTITLGHRILRTETAGMALLSVLMFQLELGQGDVSD